MKVVVNRCFGGFGISNKALLELIKRNSQYVEKINVYSYCKNKDEISRDFMEFDSEYKQHRYMNMLLKNDDLYMLKDRYLENFRSDPDLIDIIEKLGEESFGKHADLEIVNVPDDIKWYIDDYDGRETIREEHRCW
jgi:hypothetical protein